MPWSPVFTLTVTDGHLQSITLGHPLVDEYLTFAGARLRPNSWRAVALDLQVFFALVPKEPVAVTSADVFAFIAAQRAPRRVPTIVRLEDGERGLSARTIKRSSSGSSGPGAALGVMAPFELGHESGEVELADVRRSHIERHKQHLATRPAVRPDRHGATVLARSSVAAHLRTLRLAFTRLAEWAGAGDSDDAPRRVLLFPGDFRCSINRCPASWTTPRQRDDAAAKGQVGRRRLFDGLLTRLA